MLKQKYLKNLSSDLSEQEVKWQTELYQTLPLKLKKIIDETVDIKKASTETINTSIGLIDNTSLAEDLTPMFGEEDADAIIQLCKDSSSNNSNLQTATVCIYPNQIEIAKEALQDTDVGIATVNNFPHGDQSVEEALEQVREAARNGADEIDTVLDYEAFLNGDSNKAYNKLKAVSDECKKHGLVLKTILKASTYNNYKALHQASIIACMAGSDFVKTCTGKKPKSGFGTGANDASNILTMAIVMQAVSSYNKEYRADIGVKISGGVKYPIDCEKMRYLVDNIMGSKYYNSDKLRIGASSLLSNLVNANAPTETKQQLKTESKFAY